MALVCTASTDRLLNPAPNGLPCRHGPLAVLRPTAARCCRRLHLSWSPWLNWQGGQTFRHITKFLGCLAARCATSFGVATTFVPSFAFVMYDAPFQTFTGRNGSGQTSMHSRTWEPARHNLSLLYEDLTSLPYNLRMLSTSSHSGLQ